MEYWVIVTTTDYCDDCGCCQFVSGPYELREEAEKYVEKCGNDNSIAKAFVCKRD